MADYDSMPSAVTIPAVRIPSARRWPDGAGPPGRRRSPRPPGRGPGRTEALELSGVSVTLPPVTPIGNLDRHR